MHEPLDGGLTVFAKTGTGLEQHKDTGLGGPTEVPAIHTCLIRRQDQREERILRKMKSGLLMLSFLNRLLVDEGLPFGAVGIVQCSISVVVSDFHSWIRKFVEVL
jgi:hypothetical protein